MKWIAHRGGYPENSRQALLRSRNDTSVDGVEIDVRFSRDGQPMVYHDPTLDRIHHMRVRVLDLNKRDLVRRYNILGLEELFLLWSGSPKEVILEIKEIPSEQELEVLEKLCQRFQHQIKMMVACFCEPVLTTWTITPRMILCCNRFLVIPWSKDYGAVGISEEVCHSSYLQEIRAHHHPRPVLIFVFTVNSPLQAMEILGTGIDGILSDRVVNLRQELLLETC